MPLPYAELHCKTNFSFLEGASHGEELVRRAVELDYYALAITDRNSLSGVVRAHTAAKEVELKLLMGAEITPSDALPVVLWATDRAAYGRLSHLITVGRRRAPKGECQLRFQDVADHAQGLLAGIVPAPHHRRNPREDARLHDFRDVFTDRAYLLAELHCGPDDAGELAALKRLSRTARLPLVAAGDVHYHVPERMLLADVLAAVREGKTVAEVGAQRFANAQRHLRCVAQLERLYASAPDALPRTCEITDRCRFSLDQLRYEYPRELAPSGLSPHHYLRDLTWEGAHQRYPQGIPDKVRQLIEHELELIRDLAYEPYFLTVWDLVRFARSRGILCQGRGSAANSAVCFCLGITSVDPQYMDVLFERFVSRERNEAPDIDVDFEHERREEVIQYIYQKYGRERAGMTAEVITYRLRSAIRDAGKALGLSLDRVDALAKQVEAYTHDNNLPAHCRAVGINPESKTGRELITTVTELVGFPRHLSQHVGGMVITEGPLCEMVPIENAAMADRTVISWDKNDLDDLGMLKVDVLALGMLTAIRKSFQMIGRHTGRRLTLASIPPGDQRVYDMMCRADTMGVFQIESRAQMSMLPRLKPRCYYDLVIEVAIVRPGPIQGQMVHPYLRRRAGEEQPTYATEEIREVLEKTLGVPIFQEQAMRLAVVAAGFTPGEADQLRRAMGAWRRPGVIDNFRHQLIAGMRAKGLTEQFAAQVFTQIRGFGEYGFPESHAASFALLVYVSAWLKYHYPAVFVAAVINSQPMGFYAPAQLIRDARAHQVEVRPIDVNSSHWDCQLEPIQPPRPAVERGQVASSASANLALRLGMRLIVGFPQRCAEAITRARRDGPFRSLEDFTRRTRLTRAVITRLAEADALRSLGRDRRQALWEALAQEKNPRAFPLFDQVPACDEQPVMLPEMAQLENVFADYQTTGLSLKAHPLSFYRPQLAERAVRTAADLAELPNDHCVRIAGLVILRQRPSTAKGITFVTLEDESGVANLVVHHTTWRKYYGVARRSPAWVADGTLQSHHTVIHVVVTRLMDLAQFLKETSATSWAQKSRDFR